MTVTTTVPSAITMKAKLFVFGGLGSACSSAIVPMATPRRMVRPMMARVPSTVPIGAVTRPANVVTRGSLRVLTATLSPIIRVLITVDFPVTSIVVINTYFFFVLNGSRGT